MGLLDQFGDFIKTPEGQGVLSGLFGYAANAKRGTPINNLGRGGLAGVMGYGNAVQGQEEAEQRKVQNAYNQQMMGYNMTQAETARMKAESERKRLEQKVLEDRGFNQFMMPGFLKAVGADPVMAQKVSYDQEGYPMLSDMLDEPTAIRVSDTIKQPQQSGFMSTLDPDIRDALAAGFADPKMRGRAMSEMFKLYGATKRGGDPAQKLSSIQYNEAGEPWGYNSATGQFQPIGGGFKKGKSQPLVKIQGPFNEGEKGFKHELSLRGDFRTEPMYKAYQQVESAYRQINAGLDKVSPAGDMAAATKVMKLLDPDSVVRESELAMAMEATGLLDRITSYADRTLKGEKLTPNQRKDFRDLAEKLFDQAAESYNNKRGEYVKIADDYGFDPERAFGKPASKPKFGTKPSATSSNANKLSPAEQAELDQLRKRFGK